jgi:Uma2 family endonuclease
MTLEEFLLAEEEEGYRYELGGGILEVTEIPGTPHRRVVNNLYLAMARYVFDHPGQVECFGGGSEFRLWMPRMISGRNPDLGVVIEGTQPDERGRTQPSLVAEVVSRSSRKRDYVTKRREYLTYPTVQEYWIVDPRDRRVAVLVRQGDDWAETVVAGDAVIPSVVLPGLACRVEELWVGVAGEDE